ncbi:MAG: hypothetical protein IKI28_01315 [Bacteroidales bacterium]|nr:hypothetical protein [Bacteroidales bacterium]
MIHVCLTHDIDRIDKTYQYLTKPLAALKTGNIGLALRRAFSPQTVRRPYWGFDKIMQIEEKYRVRSTCFFLNESIKCKLTKPKTWKLALGRYDIHDKRIVSIIKELDANGWEIGVHGSYNSYNNYDLLKHEKETLEAIVGHEVIGIRQHYLNFCDNTWQVQHQAGFKYDSTWGLTRGIGFKNEKVKPFFPIANADYCEIPMTIMDGSFASTPERWKKFDKIAEEIDKQNAYLVINYHNNNFDKFDFPSYVEDYERMIATMKNAGALFMTMGEACRMILDSM